jgi:hypothetical protein
MRAECKVEIKIKTNLTIHSLIYWMNPNSDNRQEGLTFHPLYLWHGRPITQRISPRTYYLKRYCPLWAIIRRIYKPRWVVMGLFSEYKWHSYNTNLPPPLYASITLTFLPFSILHRRAIPQRIWPQTYELKIYCPRQWWWEEDMK